VRQVFQPALGPPICEAGPPPGPRQTLWADSQSGQKSRDPVIAALLVDISAELPPAVELVYIFRQPWPRPETCTMHCHASCPSSRDSLTPPSSRIREPPSRGGTRRLRRDRQGWGGHWADREDRNWPCRQAMDVVYSHSAGWARSGPRLRAYSRGRHGSVREGLAKRTKRTRHKRFPSLRRRALELIALQEGCSEAVLAAENIPADVLIDLVKTAGGRQKRALRGRSGRNRDHTDAKNYRDRHASAGRTQGG
jgi:hypothetical protein